MSPMYYFPNGVGLTHFMPSAVQWRDNLLVFVFISLVILSV
jgi:hypothetical protein